MLPPIAAVGGASPIAIDLGVAPSAPSARSIRGMYRLETQSRTNAFGAPIRISSAIQQSSVRGPIHVLNRDSPRSRRILSRARAHIACWSAGVDLLPISAISLPAVLSDG